MVAGILRGGAQALLAQVLDVAVAAHLATYEPLGNSLRRQRIVRNRYLLVDVAP